MGNRIKLYFWCSICLFSSVLFGFLFVASAKDLNVFAMITFFLIMYASVLLFVGSIKELAVLNKPIIANLGELTKDFNPESEDDKKKRLIQANTSEIKKRLIQ